MTSDTVNAMGLVGAGLAVIEEIEALVTQAKSEFLLYLSQRPSTDPAQVGLAMEDFGRAVHAYLIGRKLPGLFKSVLIDPASDAAKSIRRDLDTLNKSLEKVRRMLHTTEAGQLTLSRLSENAKRRHHDEIGALLRTIEQLQAETHHAAGRTASPEKAARIRLQAGIILASRRAGLTSGSGVEGPFGRFLMQLFETLSIGTKVSSREIAEATRLANAD